MAFQTDRWFTPEEIDSIAPDELIEKSEWSRDKRAEGKRQREQIKFRLRDEGEHEFANRLENCGLPMPLVCTHCGTQKVVETQCRMRWCPACAWTIAQKRLRRFSGAVGLMKWPLMVTLTRENSDDPETVRIFRQQWAKMRRRKIIAEKMTGGVVGIEVTNIGNGWHPHLHAIVDCRWLAIHTPEPHWSDTPEIAKEKRSHAQQELAWLWGNVCGQNNSHVWVKRVRDLKALVYSLKYSVAGSDLVDSAEPIGPLLRVLQKTRLVSAFGSLHGQTAAMDGDEKPVTVCDCCGTEKSLCPAAVIYSIARIDPEKTLPSMSKTHGRQS
jgi:hypothetical protein